MRIDTLRKEQGQNTVITPERNKTTADQSQLSDDKDKKKNLLRDAEYELMRNMIKYGCTVVEVNQISESGTEEVQKTSVIEWILHELEKDDIQIADETLSKVFDTFKAGVSKSKLYSPSYFLKSQDNKIVEIVADIESDAYSISKNWYERYRISVKTEDYKLDKGILYAIYSLKLYHIKNDIDLIDKQIREMDSNDENFEIDITTFLQKKQNLLKVKKVLEEELGRT
jgi:hypothetical protein